MILGCDGCIEEFCQAFEYQEEGLYLATMKGDSSENIGQKGHFFLRMVNDKGELKVS